YLIAPDFGMSCSTVHGKPGTTAFSQCTITSLSEFIGTVDLSCSNPPPGVTCAVNPASVSLPSDGSSSSQLTVTIDASVAFGNYPLQLNGSSGGLIHSINVPIVVSNCLFCDDFEDDQLASDWNYIKPSWNESAGSLVGTTARKAIAVASPAFGGCQICSVE